MKAENWKKLGSFYKILDYNLFVIDSKNVQSQLGMHQDPFQKELPILVILHGYPNLKLHSIHLFSVKNPEMMLICRTIIP